MLLSVSERETLNCGLKDEVVAVTGKFKHDRFVACLASAIERTSSRTSELFNNCNVECLTGTCIDEGGLTRATWNGAMKMMLGIKYSKYVHWIHQATMPQVSLISSPARCLNVWCRAAPAVHEPRPSQTLSCPHPK